MLRKILDGMFFMTGFIGFLLLLGTCGYIELVRDLDILKIIIMTGSGLALMLVGYLGIKSGGIEYVD